MGILKYGVSYSYRNEKETYELILSVLLRTHDGTGDGDNDNDDHEVAQDGGHTSANRLSYSCNLDLKHPSLTLDIRVILS